MSIKNLIVTASILLFSISIPREAVMSTVAQFKTLEEIVKLSNLIVVGKKAKGPAKKEEGAPQYFSVVEILFQNSGEKIKAGAQLKIYGTNHRFYEMMAKEIREKGLSDAPIITQPVYKSSIGDRPFSGFDTLIFFLSSQDGGKDIDLLGLKLCF